MLTAAVIDQAHPRTEATPAHQRTLATPAGHRTLATPARHRGHWRERLRCDRGAMPADFTLLGVLVMLIALTVIQVCIIIHTRNVAIDAAVQGAHYAAAMGSDPADGAERTEQILDQRLSSSVTSQAQAREEGGVITVEVQLTLPIVGMIGPEGAMQVRGRAIDERQW